MSQNTKMLVGALIAAVLAVAVYYGAISPQTASNIQSQANQTLGTAPANQQPAPARSQTTPPQAPAPTGPASQTPGPAPH